MAKTDRESLILALNLINIFLLVPVMYSLTRELAILWFLLICTMAGVSLSIEFVILERK